MNNLTTTAINKYQSDGMVSLTKAGLKFGYGRIKRLPVVHYSSPIEFLFTPSSPNVKKTKLYNRHFWLDRYLELKNYNRLSHSDLLRIYIQVGFPNHPRWAKKIHARTEVDSIFGDERYSPPPNELLEGYRKKHFESNNRFMLGYHRYDISEQYLDLVGREIDPSDVSVLDYGCGVADPALYLACLGADATIADLDTKVLDFAIWRFNQRNIELQHFRAEQTESPVDIEGNNGFDFIVMNEFLEHVRDPMIFLEFVVDKIQTNGLFYDPMGREYTHSVGGDHLPEAKEVVESDEYKRLHREEFERIEGHFYRKR
jgi:SAM-dependent methyltransferase